MVALIMLQVSDWFMETSLRDAAALVFTLLLWARKPNKPEGALQAKPLGVRPRVAAL